MFKLATSLLLLTLPTALCVPEEEPATVESAVEAPTGSIVDIAAGSDNHQTLVAAVQKAGLVDALMGEGPMTVFAPTDDAFMSVPPKYLDDDAWVHHLTDILLYHVSTEGKIMAADLTEDQTIEMANLEYANVSFAESGTAMINQAEITNADIVADNGVVHIVDSVLLPESALYSIVDVAVNVPEFSILAGLVGAAGLAEALSAEGPMTLFAPTNEAFDALDNETIAHLLSPEGQEDLVHILTYHVAEYNLLTVDAEEKVTMIEMVNGEEITVVFPGNFTNMTMYNMTDNMTMTMMDDTDAPTNYMTYPPTDPVTDMEDVEVASSRVAEPEEEEPAMAMEGEGKEEMMVDDHDNSMMMKEEYVMINGDVKITTANILVNNGVIHIIDKILMPPAKVMGEEGMEEAPMDGPTGEEADADGM